MFENLLEQFTYWILVAFNFLDEYVQNKVYGSTAQCENISHTVVFP